MKTEKPVMGLAKELCRLCQNEKDSIFDCNAKERPCESAISQAKKIINGDICCPVCGKEMDGTEHGRQYCDDCKQKYAK